MKKLLALCFIAAAVCLTQAQAGGYAHTQILLVSRDGLKGTVERLPAGEFTNSAPHLGSVVRALHGTQFMVDPVSNVLVMVIYYNVNGDQDNFEWSLQEWTASGIPYNRHGDGSEIFYGDWGRVFTSGDRKSFHGMAGFYEGEASRVGPYPLGDEAGSLSISGKLDRTGRITSITATVVGQGDILAAPEDDGDQLLLNFTINAVATGWNLVD